jgi:hypothetical protein
MVGNRVTPSLLGLFIGDQLRGEIQTQMPIAIARDENVRVQKR